MDLWFLFLYCIFCLDFYKSRILYIEASENFSKVDYHIKRFGGKRFFDLIIKKNVLRLKLRQRLSGCGLGFPITKAVEMFLELAIVYNVFEWFFLLNVVLIAEYVCFALLGIRKIGYEMPVVLVKHRWRPKMFLWHNW